MQTKGYVLSKRKLSSLDARLVQIKTLDKLSALKPEEARKNVVNAKRAYAQLQHQIMQIITKNNLHVVAFIDPKEAEEARQKSMVTLTFPDYFKTKG